MISRPISLVRSIGFLLQLIGSRDRVRHWIGASPCTTLSKQPRDRHHVDQCFCPLSTKTHHVDQCFCPLSTKTHHVDQCFCPLSTKTRHVDQCFCPLSTKTHHVDQYFCPLSTKTHVNQCFCPLSTKTHHVNQCFCPFSTKIHHMDQCFWPLSTKTHHVASVPNHKNTSCGPMLLSTKHKDTSCGPNLNSNFRITFKKKKKNWFGKLVTQSKIRLQDARNWCKNQDFWQKKKNVFHSHRQRW